MDLAKVISISDALSEGAFKPRKFWPIVCTLLVLASTTIAGLEAKHSALFWLGIEQAPLKSYRTNELMMTVFFSEWMWHAWILGTIFYWIPHILGPLSRSLTNAGTGWLKLTPVSPLTLRFAQILPATTIATIWMLLNAIWIWIAVRIHGVPIEGMLPTLLSSFVYHLASVSFVVCPLSQYAFRARSGVLICSAVFFPLILFLIGWSVTSGFRQPYSIAWPFAVPYYYLLKHCIAHSIALLVLTLTMVLLFFVPIFSARVVLFVRKG